MNNKKNRKITTYALASALALSNLAFVSPTSAESYRPGDLASKLEQIRQTQEAKELQNKNKVSDAKANLKASDKVRVIVEVDGQSPIEYATKQGKLFKDLSESQKSSLYATVKSQQNSVKSKLQAKGITINYKKQFSTAFNGFSGVVEFGDVAKIEATSGVKNVYLANEYNRPTAEPSTPDMTKSHQFIQSKETWKDTGYNGKGMVISIIDTGIDPTHRDFKLTDPSKEDLTKDSVAQIVSDKALPGKFYTDKVPYGYNYYDQNDIVTDLGPGASMHGMHVAGITAANGDEANGGIKGVAPEAQVLAMKVFSNDPSYPSTWSDIYLAAIDDSIKLGADVLNMSLGSVASSYEPNSAEDLAITRAVDNGIVCAVSSGNSNQIGSGWDDPLSQNPDIGVTGAPGLNKDTISVAASGNEAYLYEHAITVEGNNSLSVLGKGIDGWKDLSDKFGGNIPVVNLGKNAADGSYKLGGPDDYKGLDVKGKIVLVARGTYTFADKTKYAAQAGAAGIIVWNATNGVQYDNQGGWDVPMMLVNSKADGEALANAINGSGTIHVAQTAKNESPEMGRMTSFTSWGVTPSLELKPEITAPGGNIYSTVNNNQYEVMSGTSMAAPHVAGGSALVQEYLKNDKRFSSLSVSERTHLAKVLLMNTSKVINDLDGHPYSPRRQGAGMMQIENAVTTPVYFYNKSTGEAKYELKDFQSKQVSMTYTAKNISDKDAFYKVDTTALTDEFYQTNDVDHNALQTGALEGAKIDAPDSIMVPAGKSVDFTVKIDLTNAKIPGFDKAGKEISVDLHNNIFVEGSVNLIGTLGNPNLTAPYVGFYGKWDSLPIVDGFKDLGETRFFDLTWLNSKAHDMKVDRDKTYWGSVPGKNFYAVSPNGDKFADDINALPSFLRNAEEVQYNILDKDGKFLRRLSAQSDVTKNTYDSGKGSIVKDSMSTIWDGKVNGEVVPDGLYNYEIKSVIGYEGAQWQSKKIPVYVDTHAPSIKATYDPDKKVVTWEGSDDGTGVQNYTIFVNGNKVGTTDNTKSSFDLSSAPNKAIVEVVAVDYAGNGAEDTAAIGDIDLPLVYITDGSKDKNGEYIPNSPEPWGAYSDNKVPVKGFVTDEIGIKTVKVNGKEVPVDFDAKTGHYNYSTTVTFDQDGPYTVQVEATDFANKSFSVARHVYVDTHAAEINVDAPERVDKNVDQVTFNVNLKDNYSYLNFYVGENHEFEVPLISPVDVVKPLNKDYKVTVPLKEGENKITLRATDLAGNETVKEVVINRADAPLTTGWVVKDDNKVYYYDEDGKMHKGFLELKQTEEDYTWTSTFYFDPTTGEMHRGWLDLSGKRYYFDQEGGVMATDITFVPENNTYFYFDSKGVAQSGIFNLFGDKAYFDAKSGLLRSAWKQVGTKMVYADKDGTLHIGWLNNSGKWYFFNKDGFMQTGWLNDGKDTYYLNSKGEKVYGWNVIGGKTYYFNSTGVKAKAGWLTVSGKKYYLNSDGLRFSNGWKSINGKYYYFDKYGVMKTGWLTVSGKKYYLNSDGSRFSNGWKSISGKFYYFDKNGVVKTGWLTVSGKKYYLNSDGSRFNNGWKKISGKYYYFNKSGVMAVNTKVGKYKVGKDGARK